MFRAALRALAILPYLALLGTSPAWAQSPIASGSLRCVPLQRDNRYVGFRLQDGEKTLADVLFHAEGALYATRVQTQGQQMLFSRFRTDGSWEVGDDSLVSVEFTQGNPYPLVSFRVPVKRFAAVVWEAARGKQPLHLFACSLPGASIFHQRGWAIPTPVIDEHVMQGAFGTSSATIVSAWSPDWTYAPAIGAYPVPVVGLWKPDEGRYIAYEFFDARLTDHSEHNLGSAYCWRSREAQQFFCLTLPYGKPYNQLRYPQDGDLFASRFRILYHTSLRHEDDPNLFVNEYIWRTYRQRLTSAPTMNDLQWLPRPYRLQSLPKPSLPRLLYRTKDDPFSLDGNLESYGVGWDSPIDYVYAQNDQQAIAGLREDLAQLAKLAQRFTVNGEECVAWRKPLEGDWRPQFGKGVPTLHNVNNWLIAIAFLDAYRHERRAEWLPLLDGMVRWSKYILYTRNCYPDVPAAMFAWDAAPIASFLLKYHFTFRDDPQRANLAQLALKLTRSLVYRCLPIFASDNNPHDDLDASFFLEPNSGMPWLGAACANEVWEAAVGVLLAHVHTGDPVLAHYLRGMLERFPLLFRDEMHPTVADYGSAFAERYGLYDGAEQPVGTRSTYGGLWGGLERLIYPVAGAQVRVVCGEKAAMAFNIVGTHTDVAEYRPGRDGNFALRLRGKPPAADAEGRFDVVLTFPLGDLRGKQVFVNDVATAAVQRFAERHDTLLVRGVREGDWIRVGEVPADVASVQPVHVKPRPPQERMPMPGFEEIPLAEQAEVSIPLNWDDNSSMAGFFGGMRFLWGVPFALVEPTQNGGKGATRQPVRLAHRATMLFALLSEEPQAQLRLTYADGSIETVSRESGAPAIQGWPPVLQWRLWMIAHPLKGELRTVTPQGGALYALTLSDLPAEQLQPALAAIQQRRQRFLAEQQMLRRWQQVAERLKAMQAVAVIPTPLVPPQGHPLVRGVSRARAFDALRFLTPDELVTPSVFTPGRFPIAFYLGGENYYQTVRAPGDGERAMQEYLRKGGTLLVSPTLPYPFYYNERGTPTVFAPKIGMPISGRGAEGREEYLKGKEVRGWEKPPQGVALRFVRNPNQRVVTSLPDEFPFPSEGDLRWRPMVNIWGEGEARYTPILTLRDNTGKEYGEGIALVEFTGGEFRGARILYIWHRLIADPEQALNILLDVISYLAHSTPPPPRQVFVPSTAAPPIIDGKLDDLSWRQAATVSLEWRFHPANAPALIALTPTVRTTARLLWDRQFLYVAFECEDPDVWSTHTGRDSYVWEGEAVEVYLDPSGKGQNYKEIDLNPLGALIDLNIPEAKNGNPADVEQSARWNAAGLRWGVSVDGTLNDRADRDRGWSAELAIPLREVLPEGEQVYVGDTWRVQFYRIERPKDSTDSTAEFLAWSPTDTFHRPERFGVLAFAGDARRVDFSAYRPGSDGSPTFTVHAGSWQIRDGVYEGKNCIEDGWLPRGAAIGDQTWKDYTVKLRYRLLSRGSDWRDGFWVGFRYGEQACYALLLTSRDAQLHKVPVQGGYNGDQERLAAAPFSSDNDWHDLTVRLRGGRIEVEQDGKLLLQYTDSQPLPAGGVTLCARRWSGSTGETVVQIAQFEVE
ncbi:MAG: carbohydrate-binding family 9-like protein [Armatimonadota bacterium]|nr:carbohydrate-binding family 9-like protein [Armatimonadota bacterium]